MTLPETAARCDPCVIVLVRGRGDVGAPWGNFERRIIAPRRSNCAHLYRPFGLSPAQARLTALLMSGRSAKEAAAILGIAESSARQYLEIVFSKTGTRRQLDLIRVVGNALMLQI
jgi:DNA-binding CsgD family transcriptional regulator